MSDTKVYEPYIRALLGTAAYFCKLVVPKPNPPEQLLAKKGGSKEFPAEAKALETRLKRLETQVLDCLVCAEYDDLTVLYLPRIRQSGPSLSAVCRV